MPNLLFDEEGKPTTLTVVVLAVIAFLAFAWFFWPKPAKAEGVSPPIPGVTGVGFAKSPFTGCWVGGNLGYASQSTEAGGVVSFDARDITYGIGIGCDGKIGATNLVAGVLADIDWTKADSAVASYNYSWFGGVRLGLLVSPTTMPYALLGYTSLDGSIPSAVLNSEGLTIGAGIETMLTNNWSLKAEYRYVDLGGEAGVFESMQHAARLGVAYRF
jgi:outer membrane immunogenic protein